MLCVLILYISGEIYSLKSTPNDKFYLLSEILPEICCWKIQSFIQMAASAGHAVAYTISLIIKHIIDCVQLHFINGFMNSVP